MKTTAWTARRYNERTVSRSSRAAALLCGLATTAFAEEADPTHALPVLLKVLTYDVNFDLRGAGDFVVLVVGEPGQAHKRDELLATLRGLSVTTVKKRPLKFAAAELKGESSLQADIDRTKASALLALPGLSSAGLTALSEVAQDNQLYTLSLEHETVEKVVAVGVSQVGGRLQIVINQRAARAIGARFDPALLKLARVIH